MVNRVILHKKLDGVRMFNQKCSIAKCDNKAKRRYKLFVAWAYAYAGGEVLYDRFCSEKCLEQGLKVRG